MKKNDLIYPGVLFAIVALCALSVAAQQSKSNASGPIPAQIAAAKKVFISNAGTECSPLSQVKVAGGPDVAYDEFYAAMKEWGQLTLVDSPVESDLVLEIHLSCPQYAQLRLFFIDPKTRILLWAVTEYSRPAALRNHLDKGFQAAVAALVTDTKSLTRPGTQSSETKTK